MTLKIGQILCNNVYGGGNKGTVWIESIQIRWFSEQSGGRLDLMRGSQRHSELSQFKGGHQARVHSDQMFLMIARWEAGPRERWQKMFKGELEKQLA